MGIYVPVNIEALEDGSFRGSFPFDSNFEVQGSRSRVVSKMYRASAGYIQNSKSPQFLELLEKHRKPGLSFIKVDLFSAYEHFLFGLISLVLGVILFTFGFSFIGYIGLYFTKLGGTPMDAAQIQKEFLEMVRVSGWATLFFFIVLWNIFWTLFYPKIMEIYASVILGNAGVRSLHLSAVSRTLNLFQRKPYWYEPEES